MTMPRKIAARVKGTLVYFEERDGLVHVWTAHSNLGAYRVDRFAGGVFCRQWVRDLAAPTVVEWK